MTTTTPPSDHVGATQPLGGLVAIPVRELRGSPNNPRERLTNIDELAVSIRENGLIQPIIVQKVPGERGYRIVAGHRRYAAVLKLGWPKVPAIIRRDLLPDEELLTMLVENGQRAGLDPIEEARALSRLKTQTGLSDLEVARKVGYSQAKVSGRLALLALPPEEQEELRGGQVSIAASVERARITSGRTNPGARGKTGPQHLGVGHPLGARAKARCQRLGHMEKRGSTKSVGGIACGECWESVVRADEREQLHATSNHQGWCVLCDTAHDPDGVSP